MERLLQHYDPDQTTSIITASGWARSGKGTSMAHLKADLESFDQHVLLIDQGIKFRAMAEVALTAAQELDSETALNSFLHSDAAYKSTLGLLDEVAVMDDDSKKARLYTPELSKASGKIGRVENAHSIAVELLRSQVERAVANGTDIVLIDGRSVESYARQFNEQGMAKFVMGWFFKCDPVIAARRSIGVFGEFEALSHVDRTQLLAESLGISDRNRSDILRSVDPLREPKNAYHLDLSSYNAPGADVPYKRGFDILHSNAMAVVDTSYTNDASEMTAPVTQLTKLALLFKGMLSHEAAGIAVGRL